MDTSNASCSGQGPSEIESAFGGLRTEMDELDKKIALLIGKLAPILGPSLPGNDQECGKEVSGASDITNRIRAFTGEVRAHALNINNTIQRIEV